MSVLLRCVFAICLLNACTSYEPGPLASDLSAGGDGRIWFETVDVYDFPDFATSPSARTIHGDLVLPKGDVRGAVILSHGSGGPGSLHRRYARWLNDMGFATFLLDHFGPRDVGNTIRDQIKVTEQGMMADVIAAQRLLGTHPSIDPARIGHIGWSKGGSTGLLAAVERFTGFAGQTEPLAFVAAFYPFCGIEMTAERLTTPLLILIGGQDDWTPPAPCKAIVAALTANGSPAEIQVYAGAVHGFDSNSSGSTVSNAITVRDTTDKCLLRVGPGGATRTLDGANGVETLASRIAYLRTCGDRGVQYGGNASARDASKTRLQTFIDTHLP